MMQSYAYTYIPKGTMHDAITRQNVLHYYLCVLNEIKKESMQLCRRIMPLAALDFCGWWFRLISRLEDKCSRMLSMELVF